MEEMQEQGVNMMSNKAKIKCTVFKSNSGALSIATLQKKMTEDQINEHQVLSLQGAFGKRKIDHTPSLY